MLKRNRRIGARHRRGAMLVFIAVCLPLLIIMAALAVDVAWMQLARTELRTATDAAARAGAKELSLKQDETAARTKAKAAAKRNMVAGEPLVVQDKEIEVGKSVQVGSGRFNFTVNASKPNAVRVFGKRTSDSKSGPVDLMFSKVLGVDQFEPTEVAASTQLDRDICLVLDRSGSMMWNLNNDNYPKGTKECDAPHPTLSRWGALATSVGAFLTELTTTVQDEHVAMVSYSSNTTECGNTYKISQIDSDLVSDYSVINSKVANISKKPVKGSTAISNGLDDGIKVLTGAKIRPFAVKTIILMTDGVHNLGKEPVESAKVAASKDIVIHTITFSDNADIKRMEAVAAAANGKHFHATTQAELTKIFREIAATLPVLTTQ
ncbi:MAG: pilus assembly protein TadG-related protein [Pirellulales bacterium]